jgi:hypothetical protein
MFHSKSYLAVSLRMIWPPFMTNFTCSSWRMSSSGDMPQRVIDSNSIASVPWGNGPAFLPKAIFTPAAGRRHAVPLLRNLGAGVETAALNRN